MTDRELLQQALDVMLVAIKAGDWKVDGACDPDYVLEAIRAQLAQPEQEPKPQAHMLITEKGVCGGVFRFRYDSETAARELGGRFSIVPLYTAPPQREWQGLTDEDVWELAQKTPDFSETVAAVEAKLKAKNDR